MKKNVLFYILVFLSMFSIFSITNAFVKNTPYENTYLIQEQMFSLKEFSNIIEHHSKEITKTEEHKEISQLSIHNIDLKDNQISFEATMEHGLKFENFTVSGMLFASYKTQEGKNSTVGKLETDNQCKIMYFQIYNDNEEEYLILDNVNVHTPHLKMYILDPNKNIHVFEGELPLEFQHINSNDFQRCDARVDLFWSSDFFERGTTKVLDMNEEILKIMEVPCENFKGLPNFLDWNGRQIYYKKIQTGADYVECYSLPYVYGEYTNVQGSLSTWSLKDYKTQGVSYYFDQDEFYGNEHYLLWQGDILYEGNGETRKTDGRFHFSFDVWDMEKEESIENIEEELSFPYTAKLLP